jgi:hypothetical protein
MLSVSTSVFVSTGGQASFSTDLCQIDLPYACYGTLVEARLAQSDLVIVFVRPDC